MTRQTAPLPNQQPKIERSGAAVNTLFRTDWILLTGFCAFLFFFGLSSFGLVGADEPRYAQVAREMLARHDWITPVLNGKPWLEKPPFYYWQAMFAYSLFGVSDWAARLPSAADSTIMVLAIYFFLRRFRPGLHLDGALMTASAAAVIGFARAASTDMPLAAMFTIAMLAWYAWCESGRRSYLAAGYICLGLATLAKGPVAPFLAAIVILVLALVTNDHRLIRRTLWIPGIVLFCAVASPWFVAVQMKNPQFFRVFILQHNLARFATDLYRHKEPFWYFVPVMLLALVPWTVLACASLAQTIWFWGRRRNEMLRSGESLDSFLAIWLIVPLIFFSISQSKLPGYILPAVPAGTLLAVQYARRNRDERPGLAVVVLHSILAGLLLVPSLMIQYLVLQYRLPWGRAAAVSTVFAAVLAIGLAVTLRSRAGWSGLRFTLVPVALGVAAVLRLGAPALDSSLSARPVANELSRLEKTRLPLAVLRVPRELQFGLAFYRDQEIPRYELGEIPGQQHLLVAPEGSQVEIAKQVPGRRVSYLGTFAPQGLDYYWVAASGR
jgi:4-amino-4-deoxy-L-arabinose transferase-like glycosyltransferase